MHKFPACITKVLFLSIVAMIPINGQAEEYSAEQLEFFESRIRPVLVQQCYECHNSAETQEGALVLDHRAAILKGGESGPALVATMPDKSLLLKVIRHEIKDKEMPEGGSRLSDKVIADFETWIKQGAADPRNAPPTANELAQSTSWEAIREKRKGWWSFQPLQQVEPPHVANTAWSEHPVDRFILAKLEQANLTPSEMADKRTLIRRLSFTLTGLPPTADEIKKYLSDDSPTAFDTLVDHYLSSLRYGEHWARHWMDWVRYAESHGSEGDPAIPNAWQYRDYLIRALNADVPYNQVVKEHIAGDLLSDPRLNTELGINESAIGPAYWRMCFHGFAPTDALDEKVRFIDDQINVFSKAFLGLTVSCARCHNHKFDPISQKDYYALFGILGSTHPTLVDINTPEKQNLHKDQLTQLKQQIRDGLAQAWQNALPKIREQLLQPDAELAAMISNATDPHSALFLLNQLSSQTGDDGKRISTFWKNYQQQYQPQATSSDDPASVLRHWSLSDRNDVDQWKLAGNSLGEQLGPGEFSLNMAGGAALATIHPVGIYSHLLSTKHRGVLCSPRVKLDDEYELWVQVAGDQQAMVRYVVHDYPRSGTVYPIRRLNGDNWHWEQFDLSYWNGEEVHVEVSTAADQAVLATNNERSWFGVRDVVIAKKGTWKPPVETELQLLFVHHAGDNEITDRSSIVDVYLNTLNSAVGAFAEKQTSNAQAELLDQFVKMELLPNQLALLSAELQQLLARYRQFEAEIPAPTRVPGLLEAEAVDQPLMVRGNHHQFAEPVPRRFLEAIDDAPYTSTSSGRLELANDLFRPDNPLTSRVIVNRLWHYLYGQGLVSTVDNFGRLGEEPSHAALLDYLANRMQEHQWSIKDSIRFLVSTKTWQQSSTPSALASEIDPENRLLSHANIRRLEAESIRDQLMSLSGRLSDEMYGPGQNGTNHNRRSVYSTVFRNSLDPFLAAFDAPVPFATQGRRNATNVPAQSLTLLNDSFVSGIASSFAKRPQAINLADQQRITWYFTTALGHPPTQLQIEAAQTYLSQVKADWNELRNRHQKLIAQQQSLQAQIHSVLEPARQQLMSEQGTQVAKRNAPIPFAHWSFDNGFEDAIGSLHGKPHGNANVVDGVLILDGNSYVSTPALPVEVTAKTLEVLVQLDSLDQRGGGAISIQTLDGQFFDSIVFGEQAPRHWISGSNNFQRTVPFNGPAETENSQPVHLAIAYDDDGTIRCYRNGVLYGQPYKKSNRFTFAPEQSQILFGLRHGTSISGNRMLTGKILQASLHTRALNATEIADSALHQTGFVSDKQVRAALNAERLKQVSQHERKLQEVRERIQQLGPISEADQSWTDLTLAILNLKELIYLR